ncbi:DEAD/DEAH box helicase [Glaciecola sp. 2405UD65-10]|uniref:DEAD/DEAH box helicase n=1 Tax=Glaciecola sp. 2405UD65-10 TaxID=3397244 RepID=UPI003B5B45CC
MRLRNWQLLCSDKAIASYLSNDKHFLCVATPGAGKTRMTADVVDKLLNLDLIDFVFCFTPSVVTAQSMRKSIEQVINAPMNGHIGSKGLCVTYQSLNFKDTSFWNVFKQYRVFAIFDEIHHCGGNSIEDSNVWAQHILRNIEAHASYTMALSGTPWRSDKRAVTLSRYNESNGSIICDYEYGLTQAINESVCRVPSVTVIDNNLISITDRKNVKHHYTSIEDALESSSISYQTIVEAEPIIKFCLQQSILKLDYVRKENSRAAGLVVASTVDHAFKIATILQHNFERTVIVVSHHDINSLDIINSFQDTDIEWLVAVAMVSEGTNIPRLQVCCHLTRIKTELHFRQILGRIVRLNAKEKNRTAHLFAPAQPQLIEYSKRLSDDIPAASSTIVVSSQTPITVLENEEERHPPDSDHNSSDKKQITSENLRFNEGKDNLSMPTLDDVFFKKLRFNGQFSHSVVYEFPQA